MTCDVSCIVVVCAVDGCVVVTTVDGACVVGVVDGAWTVEFDGACVTGIAVNRVDVGTSCVVVISSVVVPGTIGFAQFPQVTYPLGPHVPDTESNCKFSSHTCCVGLVDGLPSLHT